MDKRQRIAMQRALVREALGKLRAVEELFGIEDGAVADDLSDLNDFTRKVNEFEAWVNDEGPLA
jgi:hypothetical protein